MSDTVETRSISYDAARRVLDAAVAAAASAGKSMCIAVTDPSGLPVLTARMDGSPRLSLQIAQDKAYSVASFGGLPTDAWWAMIKDEPALVHGITHTPRLTIFGGGVPLVVAGALVGAIGVSGGSAEEDREIAQAGADAVS
ncbi:MAG: heme-binding protein [Actinomycetia bacterium]|nr:heme-binding protein [Actinomycetes bacterium]MCP3913614.1 heme-binding protein [Actinomycetes bacterium]MCP4085251.1 heme-binding protein [Actinomycetes bacterium]